MDTREVITQIRKDVGEVKAKGQEVISIQALEKYLDGLFNEAIKGNETMAKLQHESNLAYYDAEVKISLEMLRSVFQYGQAALKSAILINGGACVAMLSFISSQISKSASSFLISNISNSLILFGFGTLVAAIASGSAYLTQSCYHNKKDKLGNFFNIATRFLVVGSYSFFGYGAYMAYLTFKSTY